MKTTLLLFVALFFSVTVHSQEISGKSVTSGKVVYSNKVKFEIKLEGEAAQFAESLPKEQISNKALIFTPSYSLYLDDNSKKSEEIMPAQTSHMTVRMIVSGGNDKIFCDLTNHRKVEQKEFMTRMFLIEDELGTAEWKLTTNYTTILGYNCQEAIREDNGRKISAWFTSSVPVSTGPSGFGGLPGLILLVDINNGKQIITASSIDPSFSDPGVLVAPKEGKRVSAEEYKKIVDEKMKEMGNEGGEGGAHIMIKIKN